MSEDIMTAIGQRFDRLEQLTLIGAKPVLNLEEAVVFTGLSKGHLYRLTSEKQIPYYKKCRKLYFKKSELEYYAAYDRHCRIPVDDYRQENG